MVIEVKHAVVVKNTLYPIVKQVKTFTFDALPVQLGNQFGPCHWPTKPGEHSTRRATTQC